ncbi:hypothetical protein EXU57_04225 [Segetibacter sp. 3557_3]|uniref:hypothetical protein n=1 Tax=Segetibacter sp. 3557_3 TaxID=2547429 RepID=UPI00105870F0|nr:hypothetical protein [Segetibacter sp. 3557_3]TDH29276.1 hypothetical protein EXU57_04225 [Segetibacter sp. 3557_3]
MKIHAFVLLLFSVVQCHETSVHHTNIRHEASGYSSNYVWKRLVDNGPWKPSYNFQLFSIRDTLWSFHHDGAWYSADGMQWKESPLLNAIHNHGFLDYVYFRNAIYGLGFFKGNIEQYHFIPAIFKTEDYIKWDTITLNSNLPARYFYHPFVFRNKIWIIGGERDGVIFSDVWNSADAVTWLKVKDSLPFGRRSNSQVVELDGKLFLLNNDVWSSVNGLDWQKETDQIVAGANIFGYAAIVFDNKIWLLGCNRNQQFSSEVFVSENGKQWTSEAAPWTPRGGIAATVHQGKIFLTGGKYGGTPGQPRFVYSNDIWTLEPSADNPRKQ